MKIEEAIEILENGGWWDLLIPITTIEGRSDEDKLHQAIDMAISALRPFSRERMRGEWIAVGAITCKCSRCQHSELSTRANEYLFCPRCGAPMTDEAVQMVMERMEALYENIYNG